MRISKLFESIAKLVSGDQLPHVGLFSSWHFGPWNHHANKHQTCNPIARWDSTVCFPKTDSAWDCCSSTRSVAIGSFGKILLLMVVISIPLYAEAGFFGSDRLATYQGTTLDRADVLPVLELMNSQEKAILRKDKEKLELFVRKELIRKYLIEQARKTMLDDAPLRAFQMQLSSEHELYRLFVLHENTLPKGYPEQGLLQKIYKQNIQQFTTPGKVHLRQIFLPVSKRNSLKKQLNEARFMMSQIKKGKKTFAGYAKSHSKHKASAVKGGDLGWLSRDALLPSIAKALKAMPAKHHVQLVQTSTFVRLIELLGTRQGTVLAFDRVRPVLLEKMRTQKQNELNQTYLSLLLKDNPIAIKNFKLLRKAMDSHQRSTFESRGRVVIARMGEVTLDLNACLKQLNVLESVQHMQASKMDDSFVKKSLISTTLLKKLVIAKAKAAGFDQRDHVALGMRRAAEDVLIQDKLKAMAVLPASFPSDKQLLAAYQQNKSQFTHSDMIHMGQIFIAKTKDRDQNKKLFKAVKDMHQLLVKKPEMFASLAKRYSQNVASKNDHGDMGWLKLDALLPEFKTIAKKMKPDMISSIIKTEQGWHIVKFFAFKKAGVYAMDEVKPTLQAALRQAEQNQRIQKKSNSLLFNKAISIDEDERDKLL